MPKWLVVYMGRRDDGHLERKWLRIDTTETDALRYANEMLRNGEADSMYGIHIAKVTHRVYRSEEIFVEPA